MKHIPETRLLQSIGKGGQLLQLPGEQTAQGLLQLGQHQPGRAAERGQLAEQLPLLLGNPFLGAQSAELVEILFCKTAHSLLPGLGRQTAAADQPGDQGHVGQVQQTLLGQSPKTGRRQRQHLQTAVPVHGTDALQTDLTDLLVGLGGLGDAVDLLVIVELVQLPGGGLAVF